MTPFLLPRLASAGLLLLMTSACASAPPAADPPPAAAVSAATIDSLWQQIQAASANAVCDNSSQCHALGVGAKACGGPESYIAWSSKQDDGAALKQLVARHAAARRADNVREAVMSTCSMVSPPGASCQANRCVLGPKANIAAPDVQ
ncbi:hypothetical protein ASF61_12620 [Duganella sp. Leaf126]|uniref:hypothetical protein n=1 Tax=Duganella sp. Leaf126 TaxID=1736266 RepID=UPI0006F3D988|nr:hypothetical protein [Duganella sp. Leaf126]KQQ32933.1 hypothetical protein ASF61_12620 [Duganella sp. Leaf126]